MKIIQLTSEPDWSDTLRTAIELTEALGASAELVRLSAGSFLGYVTAPIKFARKLRDVTTPVIIHSHSIGAASVASGAISLSGHRQVRTVVTLHDLPDRLSLADRKTLDSCDAIVVNSRWIASRLEGAGYNPGNRLHYIAPGVRVPAHIPPLPFASDPTGTVTFVHHGLLTPDSGISELIDSFIAISSEIPARLVIAGEGRGRFVMPLIRRIRSAKLDNRVNWTGPVDDIGAVLRGCDIGVYPAKTGYPYTRGILECMALGRAVITTSGGPADELVNNCGSAMLVPSCDRHAIAEAMRRLATDSDAMRHYAKDALSHTADSFPISTCRSSLHALYASL